MVGNYKSSYEHLTIILLLLGSLRCENHDVLSSFYGLKAHPFPKQNGKKIVRISVNYLSSNNFKHEARKSDWKGRRLKVPLDLFFSISKVEGSLEMAMEKPALINVNTCLNTNIYSYLETSGSQSSNLCLNVVHFFNTSVN